MDLKDFTRRAERGGRRGGDIPADSSYCYWSGAAGTLPVKSDLKAALPHKSRDAAQLTCKPTWRPWPFTRLLCTLIFRPIQTLQERTRCPIPQTFEFLAANQRNEG